MNPHNSSARILNTWNTLVALGHLMITFTCIRCRWNLECIIENCINLTNTWILHTAQRDQQQHYLSGQYLRKSLSGECWPSSRHSSLWSHSALAGPLSRWASPSMSRAWVSAMSPSPLATPPSLLAASLASHSLAALQPSLAWSMPDHQCENEGFVELLTWPRLLR